METPDSGTLAAIIAAVVMGLSTLVHFFITKGSNEVQKAATDAANKAANKADAVIKSNLDAADYEALKNAGKEVAQDLQKIADKFKNDATAGLSKDEREQLQADWLAFVAKHLNTTVMDLAHRWGKKVLMGLLARLVDEGNLARALAAKK